MGVYLSDLRRRTLSDPWGRPIGRLDDLIARGGGDEPPVLVGVRARRGRAEIILPVDAVALHDAPVPRLIPVDTIVAQGSVQRGAGDLLLGRDVLDRQVIDLRGRRVVRADDVLLAENTGWWRVTGVTTGPRAVLRRLLPWRLRPHTAGTDACLLAWADLALLPRLVHDAVEPVDGRPLVALQPADLARIAAAVSIRQAAALLAALDDAQAAATLAVLGPGRRVTLVGTLMGSMGAPRLAAILGQMPPTSAGALLADLAPEAATALLRRLEPSVAAPLHARLAYPRVSVGGAMTAAVILVPAWPPIGVQGRCPSISSGDVAPARRSSSRLSQPSSYPAC